MSRKPPSPGALLFLTLLLFTPALSMAVTITGNAFARGQTDHSGIKAVFLRIAPSTLRDSTDTDSGGHYSIDLQTGIYTVTFSRDDFFSKSLTEVSLYSSQTLPNVTLVPLSSRLLVPADFSTIQSAIDAARMADTVLVSPGRYLENINFKGKNIVLGSLFLTTGDTTYVSSTIIDGDQKGHVVEFSSGEDSTAVLCGFSVVNGKTQISNDGGGIVCLSSSPSLSHLIISGNSAVYGGGINLQYSQTRLSDSVVQNNFAQNGGGLYGFIFSGSLDNILIIKNTVTNQGAGIFATGGIYRNTVIGQNTITYASSYAGAIYFWSNNCSPSLINLCYLAFVLT